MQSIFGGGGFRPAGTLDDNATLDGGGGMGGFQVAPLFTATTHTDVTADNNYKNIYETNLSKQCA